jgi:hypothetical protein
MNAFAPIAGSAPSIHVARVQLSRFGAMNLGMRFACPSKTDANEEKMTPPRPPQQTPIPPVDPHPRRRLIDFSMPLPWVIGMFFSVVSGLFYIGWMAANQNNKLTQIVESQTKMEAKQEAISTRADVMRDQFAEMKQSQAILAIRVGALERDTKK